MTVAVAASFGRVDAGQLRGALQATNAPLVLDVRRSGAFAEQLEKIPGAVPLALDQELLQIPVVPRDRPIVAYCLCSGATSSSRVARWLVDDGYQNVAVLTGGLQSWLDAGYETEAVDLAADVLATEWKSFELTPARSTLPVTVSPDTAFLPRVAGQNFLDGRELPTKRELVPMFVDMVDSTELVVHRSAEEVLEIIQAFMEVVIDVGIYHCGDVHDFEGDGALLYFEGPGEAVPAAFRLRDELLLRRSGPLDIPLPRISLDAGPVVIGIVGTRFRQTVALVGTAVHRAARMLKIAPPGAIIATQTVVERARVTSPDLAERFSRAEHDFVLDTRHPDPVPVWVAPAP